MHTYLHTLVLYSIRICTTLTNPRQTASFAFEESNPVWVSADPRVRRVVEELLVADPAERVPARDLMKNQWLVVG